MHSLENTLFSPLFTVSHKYPEFKGFLVKVEQC